MERKLKKLDASRIEELKKYGVKPLNEASLSAITGGSYGEPSRCPQCGGFQLEVSAQLIQGGPDAGRMEVVIFCPQCGYEDWWDW